MIRHAGTAAASALVAIALIGAGAAAAAGDGPTEAPYTYRAEVVNVVDGDTIDVHVDLGFYVWIRYQRIHLAGIAAPDAADPAGAAATRHLEEMIGGRTIILKTLRGEDDPGREGSFNDWLGIAWVDGMSVNDAMVESGNAVKAP